MYKSILPLRFTARAGTRLLLPDLALSHRLVDGATYWLFSLQHTVIMEKEKCKVCVCVYVCVWHKSLRFLLGESHGASDRVVWDAGWDGREKGGSFYSNVMIVLID